MRKKIERNSKKNFKLKKEVLFWRSGLVGYGWPAEIK